MRDLDDRLELQLRAALRDEGDRVRPTVTLDRLRAAADERARRRRQAWILAAAGLAAVLVVVVAGISPLAMQPEAGASPSDFASPLASPAPAASGSPSALFGPADAPLRCANQLSPEPELTFTFPSGVLAGPATAESGLTPASLALGELLRQDPPEPSLAVSGWVQAAASQAGTLFLAPTPEADDPEPFVQVIIELEGGSWSSRSGVCDPVLVFDGAPSDPWRLDGSFPEPDAGEQSIKVIQESPLCVDGTIPPEMAAVPAPLVVEGDDWVGIGLAEFDVSPYCEPGPSADARLGLSRPLGSRVLLDLSRYPFQQRAWDAAVQSMDPRFPAFTGPGGGVLELTGASGADPAPYDIDFRPWEEVDLLILEVRCAGEGRFEVRLEEDARAFDCAGLTSVSFVPTVEEWQTFSVASTGSVRYALRMTGLTPAERYSTGPSGGIRPPETVLTWPAGFARAWPGCATLLSSEPADTTCGDEWQQLPSALAMRTSGNHALGVVTAQGWITTVRQADAISLAGDASGTAAAVDPAGAVALEVRTDASGASIVVPGPGDWLVRLVLTAEQEGSTLEAEYFARVIAGP